MDVRRRIPVTVTVTGRTGASVVTPVAALPKGPADLAQAR